MPWISTFFIVTVGALAGMVMGGIFGLAAGLIAPALFAHMMPWTNVEPVGAAAVFGAVAGIILGGGLAVFAIVVQIIHAWLRPESVVAPKA